ncbi:MAG: PilN domain-containing protein [Phycisphaerae bacterium]
MTDFDFIPPSYHDDVIHRDRARDRFLLGVALVIVMGGWFWAHEVQVVEAREHASLLTHEWTQFSRQRSTFDRLAADRERLQRRLEILAAMDDPASLTIWLAELGTLLPTGTVLTELTYESRALPDLPQQAGGRAAPARSAMGNTAERAPIVTRLRLVGAAQSNSYYSAFTARLGGSPLFRNVNTSAVRETEFADRRVLQFDVDCTVLPHEGGAK